MGLMNWFLPSRRSLARAQIEGSLKAWKGHGFFDGDPAASAKAVEDFSAPRLPKAMMDSMNPTLLAVSWLVSFVSGHHAPRDQLMPFASAGLGLLRMATAPDSKLAPWEQNIAERALVELSAFVDAGSINLNPHSGSSRREAITIAGPNSMACIIAERSYLDNKFGVGGWHMVSQASIEEGGCFYDKLTIVLRQGEEIVVWFDLTESRAQWTVEGNVKALDGFHQIALDAIGKPKLDAAKQVIAECLSRLNYQEVYRELASYLPVEETVKRLNDHAAKEELNAEELALLLVDAGMADHSAAAAGAESMFGAAFHTALGEGSKDMARSMAAAGLARHDRLLTEVFKRAVERGTLIVPQYGSAGNALKNALGTLNEPSISHENQNGSSETPRDRSRAMDELINRMKN